jgi:tripartite-type tricarboxylate transporter receptor subunit TctC
MGRKWGSKLLWSLAGCLVGLSLASLAAAAENYPDHPITLVVPSAAGGPADVSARLIADRLSTSLGQPVVVEDFPGAGGTIGMARVARAAPDGYTLLVHQTGFAITPALYAKLPFDTEKDFVPVGLLNQSSVYFVGRKSLPANNFADVVAWMKGPGKPAKFAHPGKGTTGHLQTIVLLHAIGADANLIPYRGIAPAVNDLLGEHIDLTEVGAATAGSLIRAGDIKAYASSGAVRDPAFPDIPTFAELGYKQLSRPFWHALFAPAGTPRPVLERINAALRETLADPTVEHNYARSGVAPYPEAQRSLEAAAAYVREEFDFWGKVVRANNIKVE